MSFFFGGGSPEFLTDAEAETTLLGSGDGVWF